MNPIFYDSVFALIPAGKFRMGSEQGLPLELPVHDVVIEKSFMLGAHPVTQKLWREVMGDNPSHFQENELSPVENITWHQAQNFCRKFSLLIGKAARLPTETEWEYACRAGTSSEFYWGDDARRAPDYAWFELNSMDSTHTVGQKMPNAFGLYDMVGNVWEWCHDRWRSDYAQSTEGIAASSEHGRRVIRGSAWDMDVFRCRSAYRSSEGEDLATKKVGFRILLEL